MILECVRAAMGKAVYEIIDDPEPYYGEIPDCRGVWASGTTLEECRRNLQDALDGWLILRLQRSLPIPPIDGRTIEPLKRLTTFCLGSALSSGGTWCSA